MHSERLSSKENKTSSFSAEWTEPVARKLEQNKPDLEREARPILSRIEINIKKGEVLGKRGGVGKREGT